MKDTALQEKWLLQNQFRKKYAHFDYFQSGEKIAPYIFDEEKIATHGFYPFISYTEKTITYKKQTGTKVKKRPISYASHVDSLIYSYYAYLLNDRYNEYLEEYQLHETAIAYRTNLNKTHIHFSKQAIDFIKQEDCYILVGDFEGFFDYLDHKYLKKRLHQVLGVQSLSKDWYAIYKNITKYSTWKLEDILKLNQFPHKSRNYRQLNQKKRVLNSEQFQTYKKKYVRKNPNIYGIPQGSVMSAILSNVYMIEFDRILYAYSKKMNGFYLRYSDDFIFVIPKKVTEDFQVQANFIYDLVEGIDGLNLKAEKTKQYIYENEMIMDTKNQPTSFHYLGFTFDGNNVQLRQRTVARYYKKMYRKLKNCHRRNLYLCSHKQKAVSCRELYCRYTASKSKKDREDRNFFSYVRLAKKSFPNERYLDYHIKNHMEKIRLVRKRDQKIECMILKNKNKT